ncbi:hypothetical protein STIAU_4584 [Stigmatella aurantiaca DW4/3-1]|nr:hypothetical protein STIAU_4584 [Stigmatella aurantiaca DW4/3-1]
MARQLKALPAWPPEEKLGENSLGTYLGDFDKGKKLDWLQDRPRVRAVLAQFLHLHPEDLDSQLVELTSPSKRPRPEIQFWDVDIRRVDPRKEPPPPVFPQAVLDTGDWPVLWRAPSGSGRTLVGKWIEAQGVARFIQAENWAEALGQLVDGQDTFIELMSPDGLPRDPPAGARPLSVCVAVEGAPRRRGRPQHFFPLSAEKEPEFTWDQVSSPPPATWLEPLVNWVHERSHKDPHFDAKACVDWMQDTLIPQRILDGFGTVLGFIGLYARYSKDIRSMEPKQAWMTLAKLFLRMRKDQVETQIETGKVPDLLKQLTHLGQAVLQGEHPWQEPQRWNEWLELARMPSDEQALAYLKRLSGQHGLQLNERQLQKAVEKQPPSASAILHSLQQLQLLREKRPRLYTLHPRWLLTTLLTQAADDLLNESHEKWGTALLKAHGARFVMASLLGRCGTGDFKPIQRLLETRPFDSPAWAAAVECAFRALGLTVFRGTSEVPQKILSEVLELQQRLLIDRNGWPRPRISYSPDIDYLPLKYGLWLLAGHTLVDRLRAKPEGLHPMLTLQGNFPQGSELSQALSQVWTAVFDESSDESLQFRVLSFYGRLLPRTGLFSNAFARVHDLQVPAFLLTRLQPGALLWGDVEHASWDKLFPLLPQYAAQHQQPWEPIVNALWRAWLAQDKDGSSLFSFQQPWAQDLWALVPPEVLLSQRLSWVLREERFPYERLRDEQWSALLTSWKDNPHRDFSERENRLWQHTPARFIRQAIAERLIRPHDNAALRQIWKTAASTVRDEVQRLLQEGDAEWAMTLAWSAPPEETPNLLALVHQASRHNDAPRATFISWLHGRITDRTPGWEQAWTLLNELTGLKPMTRGG